MKQETEYQSLNGSVIITNRGRAQNWILSTERKESVHALLSILNPYGSLLNSKHLSGANKIPLCRTLRFEDVETDEEDAPKEEHVESILNFGKLITPFLLKDPAEPATSRVVIHCRKGQSRSTAAAVMMYAQALGDPEEAWRRAKASSECIYYFGPNVLMLEYADSILGFGGKLLRNPL